MYKSITLLILFLSSVLLSGQIVESKVAMSSGEQSALEVDLKGDAKSAEKLWKEKIKPYGKSDWDRKNKEHVLFNVIIPDISSEKVTVVARFDSRSDMVKGVFWIKEDGAFVSSESGEETMRHLGEFLLDYSYDVERNDIRKRIESQEKKLDKLQKDLKKLEKKNSNLHKDIEKAKAEIAKKEKEIEENLEGQDSKKSEIDQQKDVIRQSTEELSKVGKSGSN